MFLTKTIKCRHWESHPGYRRHKPRYCSYTIAAVKECRFDVEVCLFGPRFTFKNKNALAGNQTRVSSVAGMYTITVLPARKNKSCHFCGKMRLAGDAGCNPNCGTQIVLEFGVLAQLEACVVSNDEVLGSKPRYSIFASHWIIIFVWQLDMCRPRF